MSLTSKNVVARSELSIQASAEDAYRAFVEPERLARFWLESASAPLELGKKVEWSFLVPGAKDTVEVTALVPQERIEVRSSDGTTIAWRFSRRDDRTVVEITQSGFTGDEAIANALEATQGFTLVLCSLKLLLERGDPMDVVRDKARLIEAQLRATKLGR